MENRAHTQNLLNIIHRLNKNACSLWTAIKLAEQLPPESHSAAIILCKRCFEVLQKDIKQIELELDGGGIKCHE